CGEYHRPRESLETGDPAATTGEERAGPAGLSTDRGRQMASGFSAFSRACPVLLGREMMGADKLPKSFPKAQVPGKIARGFPMAQLKAHSLVGFFTALAVLVGNGPTWAAKKVEDPDEKLLRQARIGTDDTSVLKFLRAHSPQIG